MNSTISLHIRYGVWIASILFFLMIFVPTSYQLIKSLLLSFVLSMIAVKSLRYRKLALHPIVFLWTLFFVVVGLCFILYGFINGNPGALRVSTVYAIWPLVYTILVAGTVYANVLDRLLCVIVIATVSIGLYGLSYFLHTIGLLPDILYVPIDQGQEIGLYEGFAKFSLYFISSLNFSIPFNVAALMTWSQKLKMPVPRFLLWIALTIGLIPTILSARKALFLVVSLSPIITLIFHAFQSSLYRKARRKLTIHFLIGASLILVCLSIYLQFSYSFNIQVLANEFAEGFRFSSDAGAVVRREQFFALMSDWAEAPLYGYGHGAVATGSIRDPEMPWAYELAYMALLFHTGLLGFLAYSAGVAWIVWMGLCMIRSGHRIGLYILPVLVGMVCFLIANATNPYLEKYDYIWVIFLPVALINQWLLTHRAKNP